MHRIAATIVMFVLSHLAWAAPFQNGSFELGPPNPCNAYNLPQGDTRITGWSISVGNIDWESGPPCGWQPSDGSNSLDLVGSGGIGGIQQTFDTIPGGLYQVQFDLAGNYGASPVIKPLAVTINGYTTNFTFDTTGKSQFDMGWTTQTVFFEADSTSSTINFVSDVTPSGGSLNAGAALDNVRVTLLSGSSPPSISKSFGAPSIQLNGSTSLTFTISNPNDTNLTGIDVTDPLPEGLVVSAPNGLTGGCSGGEVSAPPGSSTISLGGGFLEGNTSCTFSVDVTGTTPGVKNNVTGQVTSADSGPGNRASASITVVGAATSPPTIAKSFGAVTMMVGESTSLSFTITNPNRSTTLTLIGFNDTLPWGLVVATPSGLSGSCGGGSIVASPGSGAVTLSNATLRPGANCTFSVNVTATAAGIQNNTTDAITSREGGSGNTASATIRVSTTPPPPPKCIAPTITSGTLPPGTVGVAYAFTVSASGDAPLMISVGGLPAGLAFNPATGKISGVPTTAGTSTITISASNACPPGAVQTQTLIVARSTSSLSISASPNPAYFGQAVAVIVRASGVPSTPQGVVQLCAREATNAFCPPPFDTVPPGTPATSIRAPLSAPLDASGQAAFTLTGLLINNYILKASYVGDGVHEGASAGPIDEFVIKGVLLAPPKVALAAPSRASGGASMSIGVRVTPVLPAPMPTGTVRLYSGVDLVGSATLDASGSAQFNIAAATTGTLPLRADYSGDALFPPAKSPQSVVIIAAATLTQDIPAVGPVGLALLALVLAALGARLLSRRADRL